MKALTICQPYAELICRGEKFVENRTWETLYRGPLAIHAGKSREWLILDDERTKDELYNIPLAEMSFGCVVAIADMFACVSIADVRAGRVGEEYRCHEHAGGPWCWCLRNVRRLAVPCAVRGAMGLWDWQPEAAELAP